MDELMDQNRGVRRPPLFTRRAFPICLAVGIFLLGAALRYRFICIDNRPSDPANILGDADWYVYEAVWFFQPDFQPGLYDTLFPPGAPAYFAVLRWLDPSMQLLDLVQWLLSCLVPTVLGLIAGRLYGSRPALLVLAFSSLYFPLWEYFGYFISEGPFLFSLLTSFLLFVVSLQAQSHRAGAAWGFFAGLMLGASAACKSCGLFSAAIVLLPILLTRRKARFLLWPTLLSAACGAGLVLTPVAMRATRLNEGKFLLIANDAHRTFLLGHQGRAGRTWWIDEKRNFHMHFISPSAAQHFYEEQKSYPFGPYESAPNYEAGWRWIRANPAEALLLSFEHVTDMFLTALPWPGYFRSYVDWTIFFNQVFIFLVLLPALIALLRFGPGLLRADPGCIGDGMVAAAAGSIYLLAFLFLGEGRYRICYDGFMILLAARALFPGPARPFDISERKHYRSEPCTSIS